MRILVTGGLGWTAHAITAALEHDGHSLVLFDLPGVIDVGQGTSNVREVVRGDIADRRQFEAAVSDVEGIIHLAVATGDQAYEAPELAFRVNVQGTYNLFWVAHRHGYPRIVMVSSAPVHITDERWGPGRWNSSAGEDHLYDLTKRLQEEIAKDFCEPYGMKAIALRAGHIVDGRIGVDPKGHPLDQLVYCEGGWLCRHDLARACCLALSVEMDGFLALPLIGSRRGYEQFRVAETESRLGFRVECDFTSTLGRKLTSHNTGLPAPVASLLPPNPWSVTPFAKSGKRRASPSGSATRRRYVQLWQ